MTVFGDRDVPDHERSGDGVTLEGDLVSSLLVVWELVCGLGNCYGGGVMMSCVYFVMVGGC